MRISKLKIKNFRSYKELTTINFNNLTAFVGKNDIGKSTILEALDVFLNDNKGTIKLDEKDVNIESDSSEIEISASFTDLPSRVVLDRTNETSLDSEYLLNSENDFEIKKVYDKGKLKKVYIVANYPNNTNCNDLYKLSEEKLKERIRSLNINSISQTNAGKRQAIRDACYPLEFQEQELVLDTKDNLYEKIMNFFPMFFLFQADRKNSENDTEIQDPLKIVVKQVLTEPQIQNHLSEVANVIKDRLCRVAEYTTQKLTEMSPEIGSSLSPSIPDYNNLKWSDVFKNVSIYGDNIPINKRGSGIKRLVLLNFFRVEAERRLAENNSSQNIIYAIEEPETAQHPNNQRILINALKQITQLGSQVIITTHSPYVVKELSYCNLRLIIKNGDRKTVKEVAEGVLTYPSLNEVNYLAFGEYSVEYHDELYGCLVAKGWLKKFIKKQKQQNLEKLYKEKIYDNPDYKALSHYIRDQIHHPENKLNELYTLEEFKLSIDMMYQHIKMKKLTEHR